MKAMRIAGQLMMALSCLLAAGCVSTAVTVKPPKIPTLPAKADMEAKRFPTRPGNASVYVVWDRASAGPDDLFQVRLDEKNKELLAPGTFLLFNVLPGKHVLAFTGKAGKVTETVWAVEEGIYFLEIRPPPSLGAPVKVLRTDRNRGRQLVLEGKRAGSRAAGY